MPKEETCRFVIAVSQAMAQQPPAQPSAVVDCDEFKKLDYRIELKSGGNRVLTPLGIPDYDELPKVQKDPGPNLYPKMGFPDPVQARKAVSKKNKDVIDFIVTSPNELHYLVADSMMIEVLDGETVIYSDANTAALLPKGKYTWQWDGYDASGILDTQVLKSKRLKVRLTVQKGSKKQIQELMLSNKPDKANWVDVKIDRNAKTIDITVRPGFEQAAPIGTHQTIQPMPHADLVRMAKEGIEYYWTRDGSRVVGADVINAPILTAKGEYKVAVKVEPNVVPYAREFKLIDRLDPSKPGRMSEQSTSLGAFGAAKIVRQVGWLRNGNHPLPFDLIDERFRKETAHEIGHLVLDKYASIPKGKSGYSMEYDNNNNEEHSDDYSWSHKSTSTSITQKRLDALPPSSGELDIMYYFMDGQEPRTIIWRERGVFSEQDIKGTIWLSRILFNS
jgi:hypothetical protein